MTLFQISEPGESRGPAACKGRAIGIDLGTTNSLVACVEDGAPTIIRGTDGSILVPSVVRYQRRKRSADQAEQAPGRPVVGAPALAGAGDDDAAAADTIASVKRFMGRGASDAEARRALTPYQFAAARGDDGRVVQFQVGGDRVVTPVEVSAEILKELARRAEAHFQGDGGADTGDVRDPDSDDDGASQIDGAVITVPAYFDDAQRQATRDAGRLAGLNVLRLLAEPTAAALAYGLDRGSQGVYAVYDLGGGTFDISILKLTEGVFEVVATGGDSALGGDDFDRLLAEQMLRRVGITGQAGGGGDSALAGEADRVPRGLVRAALAEARAVKERLTDADDTVYTLALPDGRTIREPVTREDFRALIEPLLERTSKACRRALKDGKRRARELDGVILVGGSTRSPIVRDHVRDIFGMDPLCDLDPEQVVALGAAAQAEILSGGVAGASDVLLLDVLPLSLGIETMGGVVEKIIHRNSTIPCGAVQVFTTYADNQTGFDIHVVQGEREAVEHNRSLARFQLTGIPPLVAGAARVEIRFAVDADGILRVSAREQLTGIENAVEVKPSYGLTDEEVEQMLLDSYENAEEDLARRNLQVERVEAERILAATRAAMEADPDLLDADTERATREAMARLEVLAQGSDHVAIRAAVEALDRASKPFAERRMNRAVQAAVRGRRVADIEHEVSG